MVEREREDRGRERGRKEKGRRREKGGGREGGRMENVQTVKKTKNQDYLYMFHDVSRA